MTTNREVLVDRLSPTKISQALQDEIGYYYEVDREYDADIVDCFDMAFEFRVDNQIHDKVRKEMHQILVDIGAYEPVKENHFQTGDFRGFTLHGQKYDWYHGGGWTGWIEREAK